MDDADGTDAHPVADETGDFFDGGDGGGAVEGVLQRYSA